MSLFCFYFGQLYFSLRNQLSRNDKTGRDGASECLASDRTTASPSPELEIKPRSQADHQSHAIVTRDCHGGGVKDVGQIPNCFARMGKMSGEAAHRLFHSVRALR